MNSTIPQQSSVQRKRISKLALASMVLGILSLPALLIILSFPALFHNIGLIVDVFPLMGILAFTFGAIAIYRMGKYGNLRGTWMAIVGLVTGAFMGFLWVSLSFV